MSSRDEILKAIALSKPASTDLPGRFKIAGSIVNTTTKFLEVLHGIGGAGRLLNEITEVQALLQRKVEGGMEVVNTVKRLGTVNAEDYHLRDNAYIERAHTVVVEGAIGVAENAAVWVPESAMGHRLLPFICEELLILVDKKNIVATMHDAYEMVKVNEDGFGVFIAGPSKTADIEQSLVIGAHGPLVLNVFII